MGNWTKGKFDSIENYDGIEIGIGLTYDQFSEPDEFVKEVGKLYYPLNKGSVDETRANAELLIESLNIANETGLTPRQLLEQRNELLAKLKAIYKAQYGSGTLAQLNGVIHSSKDLINKIK